MLNLLPMVLNLKIVQAILRHVFDELVIIKPVTLLATVPEDYVFLNLFKKYILLNLTKLK